MDWKKYSKINDNSYSFLFSKELTGLKCDIWIDQVPDIRLRYGFPPYIKYETSIGNIPVSISDTPSILIDDYKEDIPNNLIDFIKKYKKELLSIDNQEIEVYDFEDILKNKITFDILLENKKKEYNNYIKRNKDYNLKRKVQL